MHSVISFLFSLLMILPVGEKSKPVGNKHVQCEIKLREQFLKAGSTGTMHILLTPTKGIHINLDPPMELKLDSSSGITKVEKLNIPKDEKKGYLDATKPVTVKFTISKKAKVGTLNLKGMFTYFYCSDAEGWCNRFKQPFDLKVNITK
ncbi:MAG: hypothetical protein HYZ33_00815 [Ignavibacteriales bacterium]|nr:hypothetical protein [Ignavibacteriales bacterium]